MTCANTPKISRMRSVTWSVLGALVLLGACTPLQPQNDQDQTSLRASALRAAAVACKEEPSPTDNVALGGIEQTLRNDKAHAALAQLDALGNTLPQAQLLKAEALRRIGRTTESKKHYERLLNSCLAGQAHHGLGLLLTATGEPIKSLSHLQSARDLLPTDASIRNDLGYAFLLRRDMEAARFELMTSVQLSPDLIKARHNLYLLAALEKQDGVMQSMAGQWAFDAGTEARLKEAARRLQQISEASTSALVAPATPPSQPKP